MRRPLVAMVLLGALAVAAIAYADPAQEFTFEIKDVKSGGRFTVAYDSRNYDTSGGVPPSPNEFYLRLPAGAKIPRGFLNRRVFCNVKKLDKTRNAKTCKRSQVGTGLVKVDARPFITDLIPANLWLFLAKGTNRKAVASLAIMGKPDPTAPVVRDIPVVRDFKAPLVFLNLFNDPTADGKYGYKIQFGNSPTQGTGVSFSIAETHIVNTGFSLTRKKKSCVKHRGGRCVRKLVRKRKLFWFTPPTCPSSGKVSFEAFFGYAAFPDITKVTELPCPRFPG